MHQKAEKKRIPISQVEVDGRITAHTLGEDKINHHNHPKIQSICAICVNCGIYIFILKKYLHYLLK